MELGYSVNFFKAMYTQTADKQIRIMSMHKKVNISVEVSGNVDIF